LALPALLVLPERSQEYEGFRPEKYLRRLLPFAEVDKADFSY